MYLGANAQEQVFLTDLSQAKDNKSYTLTAKRSALAVSGADAQSVTTLMKLGAQADATAANQQFAFVKKDGNYYLYSVGAKKFVKQKGDKKNSALGVTTTDAITFTDATSTRENSVLLKMGNLTFNINGGGDFWIDTWTTADDGNCFQIVEAGDFDPTTIPEGVSVTYNYYFNGEQFTSKTKEHGVGDAYEAPAIDYLNFSYENSDAISATNNTVKVNCTEGTLPFEKTTDQNNPKWYAVDMHSNMGAYFWNLNQDTVKVSIPENGRANYDAISSDAYQWCFMGDAAHGFKIYNKAKGFGLALGNTDPAILVADDNAATWKLAKSSAIERSFCFTKDETNMLNHQGDKLKYWSDKDQGSSCRVFSPVDVAMEYSAGLFTIPAGAVGSYSYMADAANQAEVLANLEKAKQNPFDKSVADALREISDKAKATDTLAFDANKMYRIKNVMRGGTFWMQDGTKFTNGTWDMSSVDMLWKFVAVNGGYNIRIVNSGDLLSASKDGQTSSLFSFAKLGDAQYAIKWNNTDQCYAQYGGGGIGFWNTPARGNDHAWYLVPAEGLEVKMNTAEGNTWSSLYLPFDVTLPEGLEAYTGVVSSSEGVASLHMDKVADVPANTGVILKGTAEKYMLNIAKASAVVEVGNNELKGTNVAIPLTMEDPDAPGETIEMADRCYVLGYTEANGLGLYNPAGDKLLANKAYLPVMNAMDVNCIKLVFGDVTGVEGVEAATDKADVYYDLSGRRVAHPAKGIYVKNGQKVYVK